MSATKEKETEKKIDVNSLGRYNMVMLAQQWLTVLLRSEDAKGLGPSELVKKALDDIRSGAVSPEEIHKAAAKLKSSPAPEEPKEKKAE